MPFRKLFLSRWSALLWAGGILWTAADVANDAPHAPANETAEINQTYATGDTVNTDDLTALANVMKSD